MNFKTEVKIKGELAQGVIKKGNDDSFVALLGFLGKQLSAADLRKFAVELNDVADKVDELNK